MKTVYDFDNDQQFLKIEFLPDSIQSPWYAYVFDENWNDMITSAAAVSETIGESIEYAYESLGIRGRIAVMENIMHPDSLAEIVDISLFHLQALLFASAIIVNGGYDDLEGFGFSKVNISSGNTLYILSSEDVGNDACRFL